MSYSSRSNKLHTMYTTYFSATAVLGTVNTSVRSNILGCRNLLRITNLKSHKMYRFMPPLQQRHEAAQSRRQSTYNKCPEMNVSYTRFLCFSDASERVAAMHQYLFISKTIIVERSNEELCDIDIGEPAIH